MKTKWRTLVVAAALAAQVVCHAQQPVPLSKQAIPNRGTFYTLEDSPTATSRMLAPLPCPPPSGVVYLASPYRTDVFLVDCRAHPQVDAEFLSALATLQAEVEAVCVSSVQTASAAMSLMSESADSLPMPGDGGSGTNTDNGGASSDYLVYGTNDLWMEVTLTNSGSASLLNITIHPPTTDTNNVWDVFGTTNLTTAGAGLNATNWAWLQRTAVGQTNIVITNTWSDAGFYRLGTMLDSDFDGLTDAFELLTSHTDRFNPDTDGDGLSDFYEWYVSHTPPGTPESPPTLSSRPVYGCPVP